MYCVSKRWINLNSDTHHINWRKTIYTYSLSASSQYERNMLLKWLHLGKTPNETFENNAEFSDDWCILHRAFSNGYGIKGDITKHFCTLPRIMWMWISSIFLSNHSNVYNTQMIDLQDDILNNCFTILQV